MSAHEKSSHKVDTTSSSSEKGKKRKGSCGDETSPQKKKMMESSADKISDGGSSGMSSTRSPESDKGKTSKMYSSEVFTSSSVPTTLKTKVKVKETKTSVEEEKFEFFFGKKSPFSQHHPAKFVLNGITYNCAEQYMMHQKAVLFKDEAMVKRILATNDPVQQKKLGRKVQPFDKDRWAKRSLDVVKEASEAKFSQNPELLKTLLSTHPRTLVEAAPRDRLWGIGMGASNPKARDPKQWRGRNLLGNILTQVREELSQTDEETKTN